MRGELGLQPRDLFLGHGAQLGVASRRACRGPARVRRRPSSTRGTWPTISPSSLLGLGGLAVLVGVADHGRVGHLARELLEALLDLVELLPELHGCGSLGDDQLAALALLRAPWRLRARGWRPPSVRRTGGLVVMRCSHRPGAVKVASTRAAPLGGEPDQLVAQPRDHRQQHDARDELRRETVERNAACRPASKPASPPAGNWCRSADGRW